MRTIIILLTLILASSCLRAEVAWPILTSLEISRCSDQACTSGVYYKPGPSGLSFVPEQIPAYGVSLNVVPYGIHCSVGTAQGKFSSCVWFIEQGHAPKLTGFCQRLKVDSWSLNADSTCTVAQSEYGAHIGAGPGAECVVFGLSGRSGTGAIITPWGELSASEVANSGDRYCLKPLPPSARCELSLSDDGVIDHSEVAPNAVDSRTTTLFTNCGASPKVYLGGGNKITLGTGVTADITAFSPNKDATYIISKLRTVNAKPGVYRATFVVIVSPN